MSQSWIEITLEVDKAEAEDADADSPDEQPLFGEPVPPGLPGTGAGYLPQTFGWKRTRLAVLLDATEDDSAAGQTPAPANLAVLQEAADSLEKPLPDIVGTRRVDDQDWVRLTQAQFDPIPVGQRLLILPSWHAAETQAGDREALIIDPGLAFGTGSHPTTRLCLEWLDEHDPRGLRVIDYGCGSGILTIAALKLGAGSATGVDIDPQAIKASISNAAQNSVQAAFYLPDALPAGQFDTVVANILANPLRLLGEMLAARTKTGGRIVLSGILAEQAQEMAAIYAQWFDMQPAVTDSGWVLLSGIKR